MDHDHFKVHGSYPYQCIIIHAACTKSGVLSELAMNGTKDAHCNFHDKVVE